jgi:DNA-binding transcriptional regulator GbsR (MarR family)
MDRVAAIFVDGIGAAAATSGILNQLQGRIFALLYLQPTPLPLDDIAAELEQSKSNISVQIRGLVEWHLVRRVPIGGSRKDHYESATDFWRVMQEIFERRYRFNVRQVLMAVEESTRASAASGGRASERTAFVAARLESLRAFFALLDASLAAFTQGKPLSAEDFKNVTPLEAARYRKMK